MEVLKFSLKGRTAFFKKPNINTYVSFTYGNIHKVALLGMLGAIRGYQGYANRSKKKDCYPEFYERLKDIHCAIVPINKNGSFSKKIQQFNNTIGYASKEQGGNLIVKEQWLEEPQWNIYIPLDCEEAKLLSVDIMERKCIYIPYLGKNDHPAHLEKACIFRECETILNYERIDSLFEKEKVVFGEESEEEEDEGISDFRYEEHLPVALNQNTQMYEPIPLIHTNLPIQSYVDPVYKIEEYKVVFI